MAPRLLVPGVLAASLVGNADGQTCSSRGAATCTGSCAWNGQACYDVSHQSTCQGRTQGTCSGSCAWTGTTCASATSGWGCAGRTQANCGSHCAWNGNACYTSSCSGMSSSQCTAGSGCAWNGNYCTAHSQTCSGRAQSHCAGDCMWNGQTCSQVCFQSNTAYTPDMSGPVATVSSQDLCRDQCRSRSGCAHFTYYTNTGRCHLHGSNAARTTAASTYAVGGVPYCGGSNVGVHRRRRTQSPGQLESMPSNVQNANVIGGVNAGNQFGSLFSSVSLPSLLSSVSGTSWGALAAGACAFLAALAAAKWRRSSAGRVADAAE